MFWLISAFMTAGRTMMRCRPEEPKVRGAGPKFFLDESLVREVEASGFIKNLYDNEYR